MISPWHITYCMIKILVMIYKLNKCANSCAELSVIKGTILAAARPPARHFNNLIFPLENPVNECCFVRENNFFKYHCDKTAASLN